MASEATTATTATTGGDNVSTAAAASLAVALLSKYSTADVKFDREIITIDKAATTEEAFAVLGENKILSAPVVDGGNYLGFVDIADLTAFTASVYTSGGIKGSELPKYFTSLRSLLGARADGGSKPVPEVMNMSKNNPFLPVKQGSSLLHVFGVLGDTAAHGSSVHRVPIVDPKTGTMNKIISQSAAIKFLHTHIDKLGPVVDKTLAELGLARKPVITLSADAPVLEAFELMTEHHLSALALVDDTGRIIANISNSDVRSMLTQGRLEMVGMTALSFVAACRQADTSNMGRTMAVSIVATPSSTLRVTIARLVATKVHRLYVVGETAAESHQPIGVVSLKDILNAIVVRPCKAMGINYIDTDKIGAADSEADEKME